MSSSKRFPLHFLALTLRDKIRAKFRKIRQFFTRKNRVMPCDEQPQNEEENNQEAFLMKVGGTWNICYEAEAVDEETGQRVKAVVSTGQYQHPNSDDVSFMVSFGSLAVPYCCLSVFIRNERILMVNLVASFLSMVKRSRRNLATVFSTICSNNHYYTHASNDTSDNNLLRNG